MKVDIQVHNGTGTLSEVTLGDLTIWFSYRTPIAFHTPTTGPIERDNDWGPTTAKHMCAARRSLGNGKTVSCEDFTSHLDSVLAALR